MILAILQARMSSSRLPGKILRPLMGEPMLLQQIHRIQRSKKIQKLIIATSTDSSDDPLFELCQEKGIEIFRGPLEDVLERYYLAAKSETNAETVVRLTGDCPLSDPAVIDEVIQFFQTGNYDYASNTLTPTFPDGLDVEVMKFSALEAAAREAKTPSEREHVTLFLKNRPTRFKLGNLKAPKDFSALRWTVDEAADFEFVKRVYEELYEKNPYFGTEAILALLEKDSAIQKINQNFERDEGLKKSLRKEKMDRYKKSQEMHLRACKTIPLGSQTFSKSKTHYPFGISPYFIQKAKGSKVWDVDGNEYVDFVNSLNAITLGYSDPDVDKAVTAQLKEGVIFSLPHPLEFEVAELIQSTVPCAEMVRFGKNGSDATAGAIRVARAHTGRDRVAVCGYHGWQDWYIGSTARNKGVPKAVRELTHSFTYNNIDTLKKVFQEYPDQFAAVIMEPAGPVLPDPGFLESVKELAHKNGALFIFDETITGFRFAPGGAQEYFKVTPDLATLGKGLANGYPVSAVVGKAEYMRQMEEVFFSFTFGGELLSLAAAKASIQKLKSQPVTQTLQKNGQKVMDGVNHLIQKHGIGNFLHLSGHPSWSFLNFKDCGGYNLYQIKTLFSQELWARGVLVISTHNMSFAHDSADIEKLLSAYDEIFPLIKRAIEEKTLEKQLLAKPLDNLFKIR